MASSKPWPQVTVTNRDFTKAGVVIVGAGISGMCVGIDLLRRGIKNFIIVEKSSGVGGTWRDNLYPGCACDVLSILYSYSFEQNPEWSRLYPGQEEMLDYLVDIAQRYGLYKYIRFNTAVDSAVWDDASNTWATKVSITGEKEAEYQPGYTITSNYLVSAVGQLNTPAKPDIDGLDDFRGKLMYSARWDWRYDMTDKRIAVIGSGATGVQIVPEVAKIASHVTVCQRSPGWILQRMDGPVPSSVKTLFRWLPALQHRLRAVQMYWRESFFDAALDYDGLSAQWAREQTLESLQKNFPGPENAEIRDALTPKYPVLCKRILVSDDYYSTLAQPHVKLETSKIDKITASGISFQDKKRGLFEEQYDMIVLATGFNTRQFLNPIKITGRNGRKLDEAWSGGSKALYGIVAEDMPNFGMLYGPNTNLGHSSIILMIEQQTKFINTMAETILRASQETGKAVALTPKKKRIDEFNKQLQSDLDKTAFADASCTSWYKDPKTGLITNNWSGTVIDYQKMLTDIKWDEFEGGEVIARLEGGKKSKHVGRVHEEPYVSDAALGKITMAGAAVGVAALAWRLYSSRLRVA